MKRSKLVVPIKRKVMVVIPVESPEIEEIRSRIHNGMRVDLPKMPPHLTMIPPRFLKDGQSFEENMLTHMCSLVSAEVACKHGPTACKILGYGRFRKSMLFIEPEAQPVQSIYETLRNSWTTFDTTSIAKTITPHITLVKDCVVDTNKILDLLGMYNYDPIYSGMEIELKRIVVYGKIGSDNYKELDSYDLVG